MAARRVADGRIARTAADGVGAMEWLEMGGEKKPLVMSELGCADGCGREMGAENCADGVGARDLGGEKKPLVMSELGCADGCGRHMGVGRIARMVADGMGAREWLEMGGEKKALGMSERGCADGCGRQMGGENCADGCGRRGCKGVPGNGWGEEAAEDERAWLHGRLRTANGWGELRGRLRTAVGARERLEMDGEKKPLGISKLGCADGCGRQMGGENWGGQLRMAWVQGSGWKWVGKKKAVGMSELGCVDGWLRTVWVQGVAFNGWGEEAAGDERAWLRGRLRTAWVQGSSWTWVVAARTAAGEGARSGWK